MSQYKEDGKVALWKNDKYERGGKQPYVRGHFTAHRAIKAGEKISIALWVNQSENEKAPNFSGMISDPYKPDEKGSPKGRQAPAAQPDFEDDPF
jgi:hypothetical protein